MGNDIIMDMNSYDLAVIGSGPCGYVAAIRAAQSGMKTVVFEDDKTGGACLNWGCIPTKSFSASSMALYNISRAEEFGINIKGYDIDFQKIYERKEGIVKKLSSGIEMLFKARKIALIKARAEIKTHNRISADGAEIEAKNILIAAGSKPLEIPGMEFDGKETLSSSHILELKILPKSIIIIGGGVIGCEFASIFSTFGSKITIVEMRSQLLPNEDEEISKKITQIFRKKGIEVFTETKVEKIEKTKGSVLAVLSNGKAVSTEKALISVGRSPNSKNIGIENIGIETNKEWIKVDTAFRTNIKNIYAAGDIIGGVLLAHVASKEGATAIENMSCKNTGLNYNVVPNCIFTFPEIASVGLTQKQASDNGWAPIIRKFFFSAIGKAHVEGDTDGFIKLVADSRTDKILGAQIIGAHATELIAEISLCLQFGITTEKLANVIHAHPTLSEIIQEVSEAVHNKAIHSI